MNNILNRESNTITIATFWENHLLDKYNYDPPYQRKSVWSPEKKSFLIDSILKNFPIPPIFMRQKIDDETGKTTYDIIDGKQRLTSLVQFIENKIPVSDEFENSPFFDEKISGIYFDDLNGKDLSEYKKLFWRYVIPIEYIDAADENVIDNIFDRLNRNGEPLEGQELRNSQFYDTDLIKIAEHLTKNDFWKIRLPAATNESRMEDIEFISELLFVLLEGGPQHATQDTLDQMYEKYTKPPSTDWADISEKFYKVTLFMNSLDLNYRLNKIYGVSHLYGIWCFSAYCVEEAIDANNIKEQIQQFFNILRQNPDSNEYAVAYKQSMASRTKDKSQRTKRLESLKNHCGI